MKKFYTKPSVEKIEFQPRESIMDEGGALPGVGGGNGGVSESIVSGPVVNPWGV